MAAKKVAAPKKIDTTTRREGLGNWNKLVEKRLGIMAHYDDSSSDAGAVEWMLRDPRCKLSYNVLVLDDGTVVQVAPENARAWHAGVCRPSDPDHMPYKDANSAFYGIAVAASGKDKITEPQKQALIELCVRLMKKHGWTEPWCITSHALEAWPRGRKVDIGNVYPIEQARQDILAALQGK